MTLREQFIEVLYEHNPSIPAMKWEFGYWGETINNWYKEGLKRKDPAVIPSDYTTVSSSVYTKTWTSQNKHVAKGEYPAGYAITGGGLYYPTQGFALDRDVKQHFNMDETQRLIDLNLFFYPMFESKTLEEDDDRLKYLDVDGAVRVFLKKTATMASGFEWPVTDRASWEKLKSERLRKDNIQARLPANWEQLVKEYKNRSYPLGVGGYPLGLFGTLAHLIGYEKLFYMYYDEPEFLHDILNTFTELWIAVFEQVLVDVEIDHIQFWEDISFGKGSMVSPDIIKEFMIPYYKRIISFLKARGVKLFCVDTDGDCMDIIPLFVESGVNVMLPFEAGCGMDVRKVRKEFPDLAMMGGIPKSELTEGTAHIDTLLARIAEVLRTGGYIPFLDHFTPPNVHFELFRYYRESLNRLIDEIAVQHPVVKK